MKKIKTPSESLTISTHIVLPNDANTHGNLFGGQLLRWMDATAAVCAHRHSKRVVVTASVNNVAFNSPIKIGDFVTLEAKVSRAFSSSMEVIIDASIEDHQTGEKTKVNEAIFTLVAVDQLGNALPVPAIEPETELEKERYNAALRRKQLSLVLAGKMDPKEATEITILFEK